MWTNSQLKALHPYTSFLGKYAPPKKSIVDINCATPFWYKNIVKIAQDHQGLYRKKNELPTCKEIYKTLLNKKLEHDGISTVFQNKCCDKWAKYNPRHNIHWDKMWNSSFIGFNHNIQQEKLFKIRHHILKTGEDMGKVTCLYCTHALGNTPTAGVPYETHLHIGVTCPFAVDVWKIFSPMIATLLDMPGRNIPLLDLFLGNFRKSHPLAITIISTVAHFLWKSRNEYKHELRIPNLMKTDLLIRVSLRQTVTLHYLVHKKNESLDAFEGAFTKGNVLCALKHDRNLRLII
jgi:hypothetical protein